MGGKFLLKLNIGGRPIANKYREGKMKRTLKRESKVPEIAEMEPMGGSVGGVPTRCFTSSASLLAWERPGDLYGLLVPSCERGTRTKCLLSTRLETRTKESNMCASARG